MYTIIEHPKFQQKVKHVWTEDERLEFFSYISQHPLMGDVIPQADGMRKIRWQANGKGKRGGARIIYFNLLENGVIVMVDIYAKNEKENLSNQEIQQLKGVKNG
ncbi:type II toxin-antitoxin system RelE/ParE family toxin [Conservatibacter flavescens]|uniref:DNA-binding protein n=1 Tax=Conservatibacter flavescens TaxID=28161 RepID=A0A2M8S0B6_9PAST|nr:type II toxin-antitoxin system RelE/ParE family toxin [Conservatibacter flavescens]PJG84590.1 DNA-binding protein [Conservatibacter flavescens]